MLYASLDGAIAPADEVRIPVTDDGFLRGDGAFETIHLHGGRPFALEEHLARLERSAEGLRLPVDLEAVRADVRALLAAAGPLDAALRIVVTRGGRRVLLLEEVEDGPPTLAVQTVTYAPTRVLDGIKSTSYGANMLARRLAREQGADDALLVTPHGRVLEGPTSSFFWARDGELLTPPLGERILSSITRACLLEELDVREAVCVRSDLEGAEEAFLAGSVRGVAPVHAIDGRALPAPVPGPVTARAAERLRARIERELARRTPI